MTAMFIQLSPQKVKNSDGYIVQVADRFSLEYIEDLRTAKIAVEFGPTTGIYKNSLTSWTLEKKEIPLSEQDKTKILERIAAALEFMDIKYEWC
jgi:hypothetical protein